jgi:transposase
LLGWIKKKNDMTLAQMQVRCFKEMGIRIGINARWHRLGHLNLSYKKNAARRGARAA